MVILAYFILYFAIILGTYFLLVPLRSDANSGICYLFVYSFIYGLFKDAGCSSHYYTLNFRMVNKLVFDFHLNRNTNCLDCRFGVFVLRPFTQVHVYNLD
jgi:hypothetical protein